MRLRSVASLLVLLSVLTTMLNIPFPFNIQPVLAATNAQGNVNYPGSVYATQYPTGVDIVVNLVDGMYIARAFGTTDQWPHGFDWNEYNVDADFYPAGKPDGEVYVMELFIFGKNYGLVGD